MAYTTLVAGTTITASWANANVRDQVVTPFANASARDSAITAPVEGMVCYLADTDTLWMYTGAAWYPLTERPVVKASDQSVISSTTFVDNTGLSVAVQASQKYVWRAVLYYSAGSTGDLKMGYTIPASATMIHTPFSIGAAAASGDWRSAHMTDLSAPGVAGGQLVGVRVTAIHEGTLTVAGTAGTFQLQFAQSASEAVNTTVYAGSSLHVMRAQ